MAPALRNHPFAIVDAFTTPRAFSGNPAGVLLLAEFPDDSWMQGVATELNQAETAFVVAGDDVHQLRWFTPVAEVALCGHATLAAAHLLWETDALGAETVARFTTRSGLLTAQQRGGRIVLDFPAVPAHRLDVSSGPGRAVAEALAGAHAEWVGITDHDDPGERNALAVLDSERAVRNFVPDLQAIAALPAGGLIVTARGHANNEVVSRYFAPAYGIPEDPVTGSAHCTIGPYGRDQLGARLLAEQASPRGGMLEVVTTDYDRVRLGGSARTVITGRLL